MGSDERTQGRKGVTKGERKKESKDQSLFSSSGQMHRVDGPKSTEREQKTRAKELSSHLQASMIHFTDAKGENAEPIGDRVRESEQKKRMGSKVCPAFPLFSPCFCLFESLFAPLKGVTLVSMIYWLPHPYALSSFRFDCLASRVTAPSAMSSSPTKKKYGKLVTKIVKAIIRPPRHEYDFDDVGPSSILIGLCLFFLLHFFFLYSSR